MLLFDLSFLFSQILLTTKCLVLQRSITSNTIFPTIIVTSCLYVRGLWKLIGAKVFWVSGVCSRWPDHCFLVKWHSNLNYLASSFYWYWIFWGLHSWAVCFCCFYFTSVLLIRCASVCYYQFIIEDSRFISIILLLQDLLTDMKAELLHYLPFHQENKAHTIPTNFFNSALKESHFRKFDQQGHFTKLWTASYDGAAHDQHHHVVE